MSFEATRLQIWYDTPQGRIVVRLVGEVMERWLRNRPSVKTLGIGYAQPYLDWIRPWIGHPWGAAPAEMGVALKQNSGKNRIALIRPDALPFPDQCFDRVVMTHLLEGAATPKSALREVWRVLAPGGRLLVMVPNRGGLWARRDVTPFGWGRPYSPSQLKQILLDSLLEPKQSCYALFFPPLKRGRSFRTASAWEKAGNRWFAPLGGVILCEAEKVVYAFNSLRHEKLAIRHPKTMPLPIAENHIHERVDKPIP